MICVCVCTIVFLKIQSIDYTVLNMRRYAENVRPCAYFRYKWVKQTTYLTFPKCQLMCSCIVNEPSIPRA